MTSKPGQRVTVLCEDRAHQLFVYHYLRIRKVDARKIALFPLPNGKGAADDWVRKHFPEVVRWYRRQRHENVLLIVMIDVDEHTPQQRIEQLEKALRDNDLAQRNQKERIAILTPAWCLENWFSFLDQGTTDEREPQKYDYTHGGSFKRGVKPSELAMKMSAWCQTRQPDPPPSLKTSCAGWQRLELT